jgi:hypothetical protein
MSNTSIIQTPEEYKPIIRSDEYVDNGGCKIPDCGLWCPCINRKTKSIFYNQTRLNAHFKTKSHQKWLEGLNNDEETNEAYKYKYLELCKEVKARKIEIGRLHKELRRQKQQTSSLSNILAEKQMEIEALKHKYRKNYDVDIDIDDGDVDDVNNIEHTNDTANFYIQEINTIPITSQHIQTDYNLNLLD